MTQPQVLASRTVVVLVLTVPLLAFAACQRGDGSDRSAPSTSSPSPSMSTAGELDDVVDAVDGRLRLYRDAAHGFAVLVRIGDRKRVLVSGTADVAAGRPVRRGDRFHVGSITKSLTAATVLALVDEGRLSLDDTVERWLPELLEQGRRVTVEQLLSHRSGLPDFWEFIDDDEADLVWKPAAAIRLVAGRPLDFPPGTQSVYNNTNFFVLGLIAEKVTGRPIEKLIEQRVYAPVGMARTALPLTYELTVQGYAGSEEVGLPNSSLGWTAGAAVSTVDDLDRFWQALLGGDLVSGDLVADMARSRGTIEEWGIGYGLGVMVDPGRCGTMVGHSGRISGFSAESWSLLGQDRSAIVLTNDDESERGRDIADIALCP